MAPKVLIFGAGSLGIVIAWLLSRSIPESNITAICRSNYEAASTHGFELHSTIWGSGLHVKPRVAHSVSEAVAQSQTEPFDYIVVTAKALPATPSIAEMIRPAVTPGKTSIVLVQNGIGIEEEYARLYADDDVPLLSTVAFMPATRITPTVVTHDMVEHLHIGTYPAAGVPATHKRAAEAFVKLLQSTGATITLQDDIQVQRWTKVLINGPWNPICALTRLRDRQFLASGKGKVETGGLDKESVQLIRDVTLEIAKVAQACGYKDIDEKIVDATMERAGDRRWPGIQPSMLADALDERSLETDAIIGNVVRIADEKKVPVPMLRVVYLLAQGLNASFSVTK
ncbi:2-dehydropantoate 2-reductase [Xylaria nigripes]|nr:2-dehydropantoate 2-reductase [Xylaria nigripes]